MPLIKSKIGTGFTSHTRFMPIKRTFKYNLNYLYIDLFNPHETNSIPFLNLTSKLFFSCDPKKYLLPGNQSFTEKITHFLKHANSSVSFDQAFLLTSPAFFSISFNPVSFFYLYKEDDLVAIIAEVHNTYQEKHMYLLSNPVFKSNGYIQFNHEKLLHVSPFFKIEGKYHFLFLKKTDMIEVIINYDKGSKRMFNANLKLLTKPLLQTSFFKLFFNFIFTSISTFPRILFQAAILKFKHKLPHFKNKPFQSNHSLSQKTPTIMERVFIRLIDSYLKKITIGQLTLHLPDNTTNIYGQSNSNLTASIYISNYRFFTKCVIKSDIGLADAYIDGFWSTPDLSSVFSVFIKNRHLLSPTSSLSFISKLLILINHKRRKNNIKNSKKNIFSHYDLGNDFFKLFLDKNMVYSSAIFDTDQISLENAQLSKINQALSLADVQSSHHLLEIGSGWGALAIQAAKEIGCRVTTVTISDEQYKYVKQKINQEHLDHLVEVKLMDYRYLTGKFDRIISIEMLEAVGHDFLNDYFNKVSQLLEPNGKAMFQCITIPEDRYKSYLKNPDFIQTHIFPGGHLPTIEILNKTVENASLCWLSAIDIGPHYATTLSCWEERFIESKSSLQNMGFDSSFYNKWLYYFNYCKAGFETNFIHNFQFVIQK